MQFPYSCRTWPSAFAARPEWPAWCRRCQRANNLNIRFCLVKYLKTRLLRRESNNLCRAEQCQKKSSNRICKGFVCPPKTAFARGLVCLLKGVWKGFSLLKSHLRGVFPPKIRRFWKGFSLQKSLIWKEFSLLKSHLRGVFPPKIAFARGFPS